MGRFFKVLGMVLVVGATAAGAWAWHDFQRFKTQRAAEDAAARAAYLGKQEIIMYSLTTCGLCTVKRRQLQSAGIPFTEYFLDRDPGMTEVMWRKIEQAGIQQGRVGTPVFEINGKIITGNPPLSELARHWE